MVILRHHVPIMEMMRWAVGTGIITGKDNGTRLDPQGNASRAECATIIMRFLQKYQ
ncbi:MAG: S-layer homology domain-containing protein [Schaedlerella sp.]|nr:S-layer homology domain-containing protein [Lachnospiraceae bacterium]MDY4202315.1 S-layer homology domain-containing protein [Schaedlerella sp.]